MAKEVHRNVNGVVILVSHERGEKVVMLECPACFQPSEVTLMLDSAGKCLQATWSCPGNCNLENCRKCRDGLPRAISKSQRLALKKDAWRFHIFCVHSLITGRHYKSEQMWVVEDDSKEYFTAVSLASASPNSAATAAADVRAIPNVGPTGAGEPGSEEGASLDWLVSGAVKFAAEEAAKSVAAVEQRVSTLEAWRLQVEDRGTGAAEWSSPSSAPGSFEGGSSPFLWPSCDQNLSWLSASFDSAASPGPETDLFAQQEDVLMAGPAIPEPRSLTPAKRPRTTGGVGHLATGETPQDVQRLRELRDSDEGVEALVAARQVGGHFEISFDTSRALEKDSGWLLMVTGIHHIAFAARGDLDPTDDDVFSVEDIGGIQRVISRQQKVAKEQRFMVPSGENDGTVLFMSTEEIAEQRLQRKVAGVRMGEVEDTCKGRRMAVCYSQAGFYSSEVVMATIEDRATAERAVAEAWQEAASKRLDRLEQETTARRGRCRELAEAAGAEKQETERMRQRMEEQRTGDTEGEEAVQLRDALALLERKMEKRLEEEQRQLARLEEAVKTERKSLAERFRREIAEKEEVVRVLTLHEHQLQEELMAEKERRLLEKEQRDALQSDLAKKEAALQAAEVRLAATRSEKKAVEAARQEQTGAEAEVVRLRCELAQLMETVAQFEPRATEAEAMAEAEEARVATLQQNLADEKKAAAEIKVALAALQSEMKVAAKEKEALSEALDAEKNASAEAQSETEQLKAEVAQLAAKVELHKDAAVALQLEKEALNAALDAEKNASAEKEQETAEAKKETDQLKAEVVQLKADVAQQQGAAAALQSEKETVEQQKKSVEQEMETVKQQKEALAAQLAAQKTATAEAEATAAEQRNAALEAEAALAVLREEALPLLHQKVLLLVGDARQREAVAKALEGSAEELTVTLPKETKANGEDCARLCKLLLTRCPGLQKLDLTSETFGPCIKGLADGLEQHGGLQKLFLRGTVTDEAAEHFARALEKNESLTEVDLRLQSDAGVVRLARALKENTTLLDLHLEGPNIGAEAARHLADALKENGTLSGLYLVRAPPVRLTAPGQRGSIGVEGARLLAEALEENGTLQRLSLVNGNFGDAGAEHLARALQKSNALQLLSMWDCGVGDAGAEALASALEGNCSLQRLSLWYSNVGDTGAGHLARALGKNGTLRELDLRDSKVGQEGADLLAAALQKKKGTFTRLCLPKGNFDEEQRQRLCGIDDRILFL